MLCLGRIDDDGPADAPDSALCDYALSQGAAIVTKDRDFADCVDLARPLHRQQFLG